MTNRIRFEISQIELDESSDVLSENDFIITANYDISTTQLRSIESGNVWRTFTLSDIPTVTAVRITCDEILSARMNSTSDEFIISSAYILDGNITSLDFKNNSGSTAKITIQVWGTL